MPIDSLLDATEATVSLGARELACRLNGSSSNFDKTAENLARAAGVHASGELLRQLIEAEGKAVLKAQQNGTLPVGWSARDCAIPKPEPATAPAGSSRTPNVQSAMETRRTEKPDAPAGGDGTTGAATADESASNSPATRVYLGSDGVLLPMVTDAEKRARRRKIRQKRQRRGKKAEPLPPAKRGTDEAYKEFKIVTYYDETQQHRLVSATKGNHVAAGRLMRRDACRIRLHEADEKVANVDGAPWIRNQIKGQSLPLDAVGLDFYHLAEHVHTARRTVFGEEDKAGEQWTSEILHAYKHEGYDAVWEQLVRWRAGLRGGTKREAADALMHYVAERREMICYPEFLGRGWQIGSGPTEASCKTATARLKRSGMRWDRDNAEALMALECLEESGQWKLYWQSRLSPTG
jgi:hypothetical protein